MARKMLQDGTIDANTVLVDIQVAFDLMPTAYRGPTTLGPVRPPYPEMLLECSGFSAERLAFHIFDVSTPGTPAFRMRFSALTDDGAMSAGITQTVALNSDGTIPAEGATMMDYDRDDLTERDIQIVAFRLTPVALMALSLMNCKNVATEPLGAIKMRRSGTAKRRGTRPTEIRYNTIVLPGGGSKRIGSGSSAHYRASALHKVRGHFKTYTADAPLLGRAVGTYWWGWQVRGNAQHGEVSSDYRLGKNPSGHADA